MPTLSNLVGPSRKQLPFRLLAILGGLYIAYLAAANLMIHSDWFASRINAGSDKVLVEWGTAWSWFPGHLSARDVLIRSNTARMQSLTEARRISAWVSPFGLSSGTLSVYRVRASNLVSSLRSAAMLDKARPEELEYFPLIPGLEPLMPNSTQELGPFKPGKRLHIHSFKIHGEHQFALGNYRVAGGGTIEGSMEYRLRDTFQLHDTRFTFREGHVLLNSEDLLTNTWLQGVFTVYPFNPYFHRGIEKLPYIGFDTEVTGQLSNLNVLNFYLGVDPQQDIEGLSAQGKLSGRLAVDQGRVTSITDLVVDAPKVRYSGATLAIESSGLIRLHPSDDGDGIARLVTFELGPSDLIHPGSGYRLLSTDGIDVIVEGSDIALARRLEEFRAVATLRDSGVSDLTVFNHFIPQSIPVSMVSGAGELSGSLLWERGRMQGQVGIRSSDLNLKIRESSMVASVDLELALVANPDSRSISISGSRLIIDEVNINGSRSALKPWSGQVKVGKGNVYFSEEIAESMQGADSMLGIIEFADGEMEVAGSISNIDFLDYLIKQSRHIQFKGRGEFEASLILDSGVIQSASFAEFRLPGLEAHFMDFQARGRGRVRGQFGEKSSHRVLDIQARLDDVIMVRNGSQDAFIEAPVVTFRLGGRAPDIAESLEDLEIDFEIPEARVPDITVYNQYLPDNEALQLKAGSGTIRSRLAVRNDVANGQLELVAPGVEISVNSSPVTIDLLLQVSLSDGDMDSRMFRFDGSFLRVDNVKYTDGTALDDWSTVFSFGESRLQWLTPLVIDAQTRLEMSSSGPLIRLLMGTYDNLKWVDELLSVSDVRGSAQLRLQPDSLVLNRLDIAGEELQILANLRIGEKGAEGILFNRLGRLRAAVSFDGEQRDWHLFSARERFEQHPGF